MFWMTNTLNSESWWSLHLILSPFICYDIVSVESSLKIENTFKFNIKSKEKKIVLKRMFHGKIELNWFSLNEHFSSILLQWKRVSPKKEKIEIDVEITNKMTHKWVLPSRKYLRMHKSFPSHFPVQTMASLTLIGIFCWWCILKATGCVFQAILMFQFRIYWLIKSVSTFRWYKMFAQKIKIWNGQCDDIHRWDIWVVCHFPNELHFFFYYKFVNKFTQTF